MDEPWMGSWISCDSFPSRHPIFYKNFSVDSWHVKRSNITASGIYDNDRGFGEKGNRIKKKKGAGKLPRQYFYYFYSYTVSGLLCSRASGKPRWTNSAGCVFAQGFHRGAAFCFSCIWKWRWPPKYEKAGGRKSAHACRLHSIDAILQMIEGSPCLWLYGQQLHGVKQSSSLIKLLKRGWSKCICTCLFLNLIFQHISSLVPCCFFWAFIV